MIERFEWIIYVFGGLLLVSAVKMMLTDEEEFDPEKNFVVRLVRPSVPGDSRDWQWTVLRADGRPVDGHAPVPGAGA